MTTAPDARPTADGSSLAVERTRLAWRRTALGLAAGSVAAGRLLQEAAGAVAWTVTLLGLAAASSMVVAGYRRHTGTTPGGGGVVAACAVGLALLGVAALAVVLVAGLG